MIEDQCHLKQIGIIREENGDGIFANCAQVIKKEGTKCSIFMYVYFVFVRHHAQMHINN